MSSDMSGVFTLEGGYPCRDSIGAIYDELDFQRAVQAYIWATPAVGAQAVADGLAELGLSLTTVGIFENFLDANTVVATGNGESIYALGAIDLGATGPVVVDTPPGVLGFAMSGWQQPLEDIGPLGPDKGKGGRFLFLPPSSDEPVPEGHFAVPSDTMLFTWLVRGFVKDGKTEPAVEAIKGMRIYRLADAANPPPMEFVNVSGRKATLIPVGDQVDGLPFFETLARVVEREPTREQDKQFLGLLASLGIERGNPVRAGREDAGHPHQGSGDRARHDRRHLLRLALTEQAALARHEPLGGAAAHRARRLRRPRPRRARPPCRALLPGRRSVQGRPARHRRRRIQVRRRVQGPERRVVDGSRSYRLRVPPNPPVKDFWSVVVYDAETRSMIANDQGISSRNSYQQFPANDDGSINLYFGPEAPAGEQDQWVQTNPGVGFFLYFRWYGPLEPYFDKSWTLDDVEAVG